MLVSCQEATNFFAACIAFRNFAISFSVASMQARTCTCICYWEPQALSTIEMHFWWYRKCLYIHACIYNYIEGVKTRKASLRSSEWNNPALFLAASHPRPFFVHSNHSRMPFWDCEVQHRKSNWWHHWAQLSLPQRSNKNTEMLVIRTNQQHTYTHQT